MEINFVSVACQDRRGARRSRARDLEADVAKATAYVERLLGEELKGVFLAHKIEGLTFSGITSAFSSALEGKVTQLVGSWPRVAPPVG